MLHRIFRPTNAALHHSEQEENPDREEIPEKDPPESVYLCKIYKSSPSTHPLSILLDLRLFSILLDLRPLEMILDYHVLHTE
jgi:hypothetical protein